MTATRRAEEFGFDLLGIQRELKAATLADSLKRAESAMQRGDFDRVRTLLQEVIRLDRHNETANRLLREVRHTIQQQQRMSQIGQIRSQAQVALAGGQFEEALACADQALRLDPDDTDTIQLCDQIRNAISRAKAVRQAVNRAEAALFAGDFDEAKGSGRRVSAPGSIRLRSPRTRLHDQQGTGRALQACAGPGICR